MQQSIIIASATDPAVVTYVLGRNPTKAKELAAITDPLKFARAIWELEKEGIKMSTRKAPPPERQIQSNASVRAGTKNLDRLYEQAQKTGDWTEYLEAKRAKTNPK